ATGTPRSKKAFDFENEAAATTPRTPKKTTFADEEALVTPAAKTPKTPRTPRTPKTPKTPKTPAAEPEPEPPAEEVNGEEPPAEEQPADEAAPIVDEERERIRMMEKWAGAEGEPPKTPAADAEAPAAEEPAGEEAEKPAGDEEEAAPRTPARARRESPSPPPRAAREPREYVPYDEGHKETSGPTRLPDTGSFSSWVAPEKVGYQALSPLAQNAVRKYQNEYTSGSAYRPPTTYTQIFDDIVNTGAFGQNLYATNRLLERSRSRTRERRSALRGHRSASNYARFSSQYPSALRTSEYATPRSASVSRAPSRSGSFISFMDYAGSKQYDLARSDSRGLLYGATEALSRSSSRGDIPYWTGSGRISRVDSFVNNMNSRYEWNVPSTYDMYRSSSRSNLYANGYAGQAADLQRTLSKERYEKDRLRSSYAQVAYKLDQALKQIDLLRTNSYSNLRSSSLPRTSVYTHFYPYY
ncbi:Protein T23E7.2 b, partial [Aphelenchoides avenae]